MCSLKPSVYLICSSILQLVIASDPYNNNLGHVVFSHVMFRHGERMPLEMYPNDPHKDSPEWPFAIAQLTDVGKLQQYELGQWLRSRYSHMLSDKYDINEIYVQSTDVDRTLMSAQCNLAGLYRPRNDEGWDPAIAWQPIPVHTVPVVADELLGASATAPCSAYDLELQRVNSLPEVLALHEKFQGLYEYVTQHSGMDVSDFKTAIKIYDALAIEEMRNMTLPDWVQPIYPEPIKEAALYSFVLPTWSSLLQRLKIGPLLSEIVTHFDEKRAGKLSRNLWIYSAHDATVAALLNTLQAFDIHFPPYASCLMLELRVIHEDYFVTLFYRNNTAEEPHLLPIKSCSTICPLDQFVQLMQPLIPQDWQAECQLQRLLLELVMQHNISCIVFFLGTLGVFLCIVICCFTIHRLKRSPIRSYYTIPHPTPKALHCKEIVCISSH